MFSNLDGLEKHSVDLMRSRQELLSQQSVLEETERSIQQREQGLQRSISIKERERKQLTDGSRGSDRSHMFGEKIPAILADIRRQGLAGRVVGPLGMHVVLGDKIDLRHAEVVAEKALWSQLKNFVVTNPQDRNSLVEILRRHGAAANHSVLIQTERPRYSIAPTPADAITVLDLLRIESDQVYNVLVDQLKIDQILVIRDESSDLRSITTTRDGREDFKYNARQAICYDGTRITFRQGNRASEANRDRCAHLLAGDMTAAIRELSEEIAAEQELLEREREAAVSVRGQIVAVSKSVKECMAEVAHVGRQISSLRADRTRVDEDIADFQKQNAIDITHIEAELEDTVAALKSEEEKLQEEKAKLDEAKQRDKAVRREKSSWDSKNAAATKQLREIRGQIERFMETKALQESDMQKQQDQIDEYERQIAVHASKLEEALKQVEEKAAHATAESRKLIGDAFDGPIKV